MVTRLRELQQKKDAHQLHKEFVSLQSTVSLLQTQNSQINNQLRIALTEKYQKVDILQRNMETFFGDLEDQVVERSIFSIIWKTK